MFRYLRALWNWATGWLGAGADKLAENQHVMAATYDTAIAKRAARFETVKNAVSDLLGVEQDRKAQMKELGDRISKLKTIKDGAQAAMQRRINQLTGTPKEQVMVDAEFIKHKHAYEDASSTLVEVQHRFDEKDTELKGSTKQIAEFKAELQSMQRQNDKLREEKSEAIADVGVAKQKEAIANVLNGIPQDSADADLAKAREARKRVTNRATISSEIAGNDAKHAENEYLALAEQSKSNAELDNLLNWGDSKKEPLEPAKLTE